MSMGEQEALRWLRSEDLLELGMEADAARHRIHPEDVVTYDTDLHFTPFSANAESIESVLQKLRSTDGANLHLVLPSPSLHAGELSLPAVLRIVKQVKVAAPASEVYGLDATAILALSRSAGQTPRDTVAALAESGLTSLGDSGDFRLDGASRAATISSSEWIAIHRTAHTLGMKSYACLLFGAGETAEQQVTRLALLRNLQEETGGFLACTPQIYRRPLTGSRDPEEATAVDYLKVVGVSRLFLHNFENIQTRWETLGLKVLQMALKFGGNDAGSVEPQPPNTLRTSEEILRQVIRDAGLRPSQRTTDYAAHLFQ